MKAFVREVLTDVPTSLCFGAAVFFVSFVGYILFLV